VIAIPCAEPYTPDILAASQVGYCLRNSVRFASPTGRLTPQLAEDPHLLTLPSKVSFPNVRLVLCRNVNFDGNVMLVGRVIYIHIHVIDTSNSLNKHHPRALRTKHNP
jgi:hypothetical protein